MYKLVGIQGVLFAIFDDTDKAIDILTKNKMCKCLNLGIEIGGVTRVSDNEFNYLEEFFFRDNPDEDLSDDYYSYDDDYDDSDFDEDDTEEENLDTDYYDEDSDSDSEEEDFYDNFNEEDFGDYEPEEEVSTVNKLYSYLNDEQIKLLKRYYLWYSQRIFDEGKKQARTLQVTSSKRKLQKQQELNVMRNQGGMWAYAGFIDMGYKGADYCTLGHPLRYVHLAWDITVSDIETSFFGENYNNDIEEVISSSNCIKFGIDCISDFFEIDKEYTDKLKRAQREAIKDMDFMCKYYVDGIEDEVMSSFTLLDEIINKIVKVDTKGILLKGDNYKPLVPKSLSAFYRQFRQLKMVIPKSLVQEIRDNLVGWDTHKFIGWKEPDWGTISKLLSTIMGTKVDKLVNTITRGYDLYNNLIKSYFTVFFQLKSCGYYCYNADTFKEEGGASKPVRGTLQSLYRNLDKKFWSDIEYNFSFIENLAELSNSIEVSVCDVLKKYLTPTVSISQQSGRKFLDEKVKQVDFHLLREYDRVNNTDLYGTYCELDEYKNKPYNICMESYNKQRSLSMFLQQIRGYVEVLNTSSDNYISFVNSALNDEITTYNLEQDKHDEERRKKEEREEQERIQKEKEEKDIQSDDQKIRDYCIKNKKKVAGVSKLKFALSVLSTVEKTGKCSPKQMHYINQIYTELTGNQVEDKYVASKVNLDDRKDLEEAINRVIENPDLLENEDDKEKIYAILTSVSRYRTISERQMKYVEIAVKVVKEDNK